MSNDPNIEEFTKQLAAHDWFHEMSDDHGVWRRGCADWDRLTAIARRNGDEYKRAVNAEFSKHYHRAPFVEPWTFPYPDIA